MGFRIVLAVVVCAVIQAKHAFGVDYQVVESEGFGSTVESAAQNAAENALRTVVGSFIESTQRAQKETEIANGIRNETKSISSKTAQYSQGSIKNFEVVQSNEGNGLWTVKAKVEVRVEDFRAYITKVALGETDLGMDLLATMATEAKQKENINSMFEAPLSKITSGEVVEFRMEKPIRLTEYLRGDTEDIKALSHSLKHNPSWVSNQLETLGRYLEQDGWNMSLALAIPFTSTLNPDYVANLSQKLESTASGKKSAPALGEEVALHEYFTVQIGPSQQRASDTKVFDFYTLPVSSVKSFESLNLEEGQKIVVTLLDGSGGIVMKKFVSMPRKYEGDHSWMRERVGVLNTDIFNSRWDTQFGWGTMLAFQPDLHHIHGVLWLPRSGYVRVLRERTGVVLLELTPEQLSMTKKIQLSYDQ